MLLGVLTLLLSTSALAQGKDRADAEGESSESCPEEAGVSLLQVHRTLQRDLESARGSASNALFPFGGFGVMWKGYDEFAREIHRPPIPGLIVPGDVVKNRSKVGLNSTAMAQLSNVMTKPLLASSLARVPVQHDLPVSKVNGTDPIICHSYHKTGTEICAQYFAGRWSVTREPFFSCWYFNCTWVVDSGVPAPANFQYAEDVLGLLGDAPFRLLNWIREPHEIIISAFRYHLQSPENWELAERQCYSCREEDWHVMYGLPLEQCTYFQLLKSVSAANETAGLVVEALNERRNIENMLNFTSAYVNDPRVLHLSMEFLKKNFSQTMECINKFMDGKGLSPEELGVFAQFDPASPDYASDEHVTSGKYNNDGLKETLLADPVWGQEFAAASEYFSAILKRSSDSFGCPEL